MRLSCALLCLLCACSSDKYVRVDLSDGRAFYARRAEVEQPVDERGMIRVENVLTGRHLTVKRADCIVRSASRGEVTRAKGNRFVYAD